MEAAKGKISDVIAGSSLFGCRDYILEQWQLGFVKWLALPDPIGGVWKQVILKMVWLPSLLKRVAMVVLSVLSMKVVQCSDV